MWEVKGGGISFRNGEWFSQNAKGQYTIKDPVKQADNAIGVINARVKEKLGADIRFPVGRNLVFPDTRAQSLTLPLGLVREDILDYQDLHNLSATSLKKTICPLATAGQPATEQRKYRTAAATGA